MLNPFSKGFQVTSKGLVRDKFNYNWQLAFPLVVLLVTSIICLAFNLLNKPVEESFNLGLFGSGYNVIIISAALLTLLDVPRLSYDEWLTYRSQVEIVNNN